jgi:ArsR family transcriptional regulator
MQTTTLGKQELDAVLAMVENPVRRSLIKRLSQEPSYPLQLSKELGIGQQLVAKHLDALEDANIVASSLEESPSGPARKEYALKKSVSVTVDFAPNLFSARLIDLGLDSGNYSASRVSSALAKRIDKIIRSSNPHGRIGAMGKVISDIDERLRELEDERAGLLYIRNLAMSEAAKLVSESEKGGDSRRVMYHILDSHSKNVVEISQSVNLREEVVRKLLGDLERDVGL